MHYCLTLALFLLSSLLASTHSLKSLQVGHSEDKASFYIQSSKGPLATTYKLKMKNGYFFLDSPSKFWSRTVLWTERDTINLFLANYLNSVRSLQQLSLDFTLFQQCFACHTRPCLNHILGSVHGQDRMEEHVIDKPVVWNEGNAVSFCSQNF